MWQRTYHQFVNSLLNLSQSYSARIESQTHSHVASHSIISMPPSKLHFSHRHQPLSHRVTSLIGATAKPGKLD